MAETKPATQRFAPFPAEADLHTWAAELDAVAEKLAMRYLTSLLSTAERKKGWQLAELAGEATPDDM